MLFLSRRNATGKHHLSQMLCLCGHKHLKKNGDGCIPKTSMGHQQSSEAVHPGFPE
jgi:hypothetical protein